MEEKGGFEMSDEQYLERWLDEVLPFKWANGRTRRQILKDWEKEALKCL